MRVVLLILLCTLLHANALAVVIMSEKCGNATTWSLDDKGVLTISGSGAIDKVPNYKDSKGQLQQLWGKKAKKLIIEEGVDSICPYAFSCCAKLREVEIPTTLRSIGYAAFSVPEKKSQNSLKGLFNALTNQEVTPNDDESFFKKPDPTKDTIWNVNLGRVNIKDLKRWENIRFYDSNPLCVGGSSANLYLNGTKVNKNKIEYAYVTGSKRGMDYCTIWMLDRAGNLTVSGYGYIDAVYNDGFNGANYLSVVPSEKQPWDKVGIEIRHIEVENGITTIERGAFYKSTASSVVLPETLKYIYDYAFAECHDLREITMPKSLEKVGEGAFAGSSYIDRVNISDIASWCKVYFHPATGSNPLEYADGLYLNGEKITNLIIPDGVTAINNGAFQGYYGLKTVEIPNSVKYIGERAFCKTGLETATLPDYAKVCQYAFGDCPFLKTVYKPESLELDKREVFESPSNI